MSNVGSDPLELGNEESFGVVVGLDDISVPSLISAGKDGTIVRNTGFDSVHFLMEEYSRFFVAPEIQGYNFLHGFRRLVFGLSQMGWIGKWMSKGGDCEEKEVCHEERIRQNQKVNSCEMEWPSGIFGKL